MEFYEGLLPDAVKDALANIVIYPYELITGYQVSRDGGYVFLLLKQGNDYRIYILHRSDNTWKLDTMSNPLPVIHGMVPQLMGRFAYTFYIDYGDFSSTRDGEAEYFTFTICRQLNNTWMLTDYVYSYYGVDTSSYHASAFTNHGAMNMTFSTMLGNESISTKQQAFYGNYDRNLDAVQLENLPLSYEDALSFLDTANIAMVNNSNPEAKLFLRTKPDMDASSIGRYNNGAIVSVLERTNDEWTKVSIGDVSGYMLHKYLVYGDEIVNQNIPDLHRSVHYIDEDQTLPLFAKPDGSADIIIQLPYGQTMQLLGTIDEQWSHIVLDSGVYGYVKTAYIWAGNG